jgi:signal transduction histidine kinase
LLLAVTGQFIRRGRQSQDRTELLLAQLQDAREAEAAAAALAERSRIAGELHDVLAHSLSGLAIQLQGARKLAGREAVSERLRAAIDRSAELTKAGLTDARQAVSALRGGQLPSLDQLSTLVQDFRRDTGAEATLRVDGMSRPLPAEASLALFRGAQEALTNIARYAPGAATMVTVSYQAGRTVVTIEDRVCPAGAGPGPVPAPGSGLLADVGGGPAPVPQQRHGQDPHQPDLRQDRRPRPGPGRPVRLPARPGNPGSITVRRLRTGWPCSSRMSQRFSLAGNSSR